MTADLTVFREILVLVLAEHLVMLAELDPSNPEAAEDARPIEDRYAERNRHVWAAVGAAMSLGYPAGVQPDPVVPEAPMCVYIELPTGQVSWHVPMYPGQWDGHDTAEKYRRVAAYLDAAG